MQGRFSVNGSGRFRALQLVLNVSHVTKRIVKMSVTSIPATGVPLIMGFTLSGLSGVVQVTVHVMVVFCTLLALRSIGLHLRQVGK